MFTNARHFDQSAVAALRSVKRSWCPQARPKDNPILGREEAKIAAWAVQLLQCVAFNIIQN